MKKYLVAAAFALPLASAQAAPGLSGAYWLNGYGGAIGGAPDATFNTNTVCFPSCFSASGDGDMVSSFLGVPSGYTTGLSADYSGLSRHALQLTGFLNIAASAVYNLGLYSDDGSYMYVDGTLVVNNGGDHAPSGASANVFLSAGAHTLLIYQEENGGITALTASLNGDPLSGSLISTTGVPEPASWAMMVGGFGLIGGAMRRRRTAVRFA